MLKKPFHALIALFYILGVKFRHFLFNTGVLKSVKFDVPVICVGNITVGGTGKTPMSELLIEHFLAKHPIALISRGYGRSSKGYHEVTCEDNYKTAGDEPLQMKLKYPEAVVVVCEKRREGIERILKEHPEVKLIIMDDGFQHRYVTPKINIIMVDYTRPIMKDHPIPLGNLRDCKGELHRADYFIVTKCPERLTELNIKWMSEELISLAYQKIYYTRIENLTPVATFPDVAAPFDPSREVIALSGIGNPKPFIERIESKYKMVEKLTYGDHHSYSAHNLKAIAKKLERHPEAVILTTEKDSVKFAKNGNIPDVIKERLYYTPIKMAFLSGSAQKLIENIEYDIKYN